MLVSDVGDPGPQSTLPGVRQAQGSEMFGLGQKLPDFEWRYVGWAAVFALGALTIFFLMRAKPSTPLMGLGRACKRR